MRIKKRRLDSFSEMALLSDDQFEAIKVCLSHSMDRKALPRGNIKSSKSQGGRLFENTSRVK